jgi:hypothetical protein
MMHKLNYFKFLVPSVRHKYICMLITESNFPVFPKIQYLKDCQHRQKFHFAHHLRDFKTLLQAVEVYSSETCHETSILRETEQPGNLSGMSE